MYFEEEQRFSPRIEALLLFSTAFFGALAYFTTRGAPGADIGIIILIGSMALVLFMFRSLRLKTTVTGEGVRVSGLLFVNKLIAFEEIASAEARTYKPLREYGGWGYRIGPSGKAYNAQGSEGVQLVLKDGERILIGSQRATELANAISAQLRG